MSAPRVVGTRPWLPWPFSGWAWWTAPVRAERLAVLRVGLAAVLLADIFTSRLPAIRDYYGPESLGSPGLFDRLAEAPAWNLSLLRGFRDPMVYGLALWAWWVSGGLALLGLAGRLTAPRPGPHPLLRAALLVWTGVTAASAFGLWANGSTEAADGGQLVWLAPLIAFGLALVFCGLAWLCRFTEVGDRDEQWVWRCALLAACTAGLLAYLGALKAWVGDSLSPGWLAWTAKSWHHDPGVLRGAMIAWAAATALLLIGLGTRLAAVATWALALSFANLNNSIDNAGDKIRGIALLYLMLCPCGAAWSLDSWLARRRGRLSGPVYVHPWPLRLLFVQMVFIYFFNGLYKAIGDDWAAGVSLYYILCDLTLARFSYALLPAPYWLTQWMSWVVLAWELTFPLAVLFRWTRVPALLFGVLFHLGILVTMEIGGFAPFVLTLYLPLLPWDRWLAAGK